MSKAVCLHNGTVVTGFATMENCAVLVENGLISDVFSQKRFEQQRFDTDVRDIDVGGAYIVPGFIDTHIHGIGGYGTEDSILCDNENAATIGMESVLAMSELLGKRGVSAFNPTLYPAEPPLMLRAVQAISSAMGKETGAKIMGLHLEGPFISPTKLGVQKPSTIMPVNLEFMDALWEASGGHIVNMTVAPELKGMRQLALSCIKKGIVLQAGHTDAKYENMVEGMQKGILHSTHMFNAMSRMDHRNPNAAGAILIHSEISCEIIADNIHVHPDLLRLLYRDKSLDKIILITDGLKPTEQQTGPFFANGEEVTFHDGAFHRVSDDVIAGSGLSMITGVKNLMAEDFSLEEAIKTSSYNPAQVMRYTQQGAIVPGKCADITVFDKEFNIRLAMVNGNVILRR